MRTGGTTLEAEDFPMSPSTSSSSYTCDKSGENLNSHGNPLMHTVDAGCGRFVCFTSPQSSTHLNIAANNGGATTYSVPEFISDSMRVMFALFQAGKLTDVTLCVDTVRIACHRVVLMGASPYFRAMFTSGMKEEALAEIRLHYLTPLALNRLVQFSYTGEISLSEQSVCEVLAAAIMFQMSAVVNVCSEFLEGQLHTTNALGLHDFATSVGCLQLARKTQVFLDRNFSEIVKHDELLGLSVTQLCSLIRRDEIHVRTEAEVYNAVIRWINHDKAARLVHIMDCLTLVRCHALAPSFIKSQIKNSDLLAEVPESRTLLQCVLGDLLLHKNIPLCSRNDAHAQVIYSAGGYLRYSLYNFEAYNHTTGKWRRLPDLPSPRSGLAACSVRGCVYLVGGRNNNNDQVGNVDAPHMDCYDPTTNQWRTCAPMSVPRNRVAVGVVDDIIYAIGGLTNTIHHKTAEKYDVDNDLWTPIASMHHPRIGLGVAVLDRLLFAVGGFDGKRRLSSVERYDPETDAWSEVASLNRPRSGAGVVAVEKHIYAVGGYDSRSQLRSVERYNAEQNIWEYMASMIHPRSALSATVFEGHIWAFGGYDGHEFLSSIEVYDPTVDAWTKTTVMPCSRSGHAVITSREPVAAIALD